MTLRMLVDGLHEEETRMVIADDDQLIEFDIESAFKKQNKSNIYLAKVTRVEPSLQAAFVEYGSGRQGFLPFSEIHPDYYQIPVADKHELLAAQAELREIENRQMEEEIERAARRQQNQPANNTSQGDRDSSANQPGDNGEKDNYELNNTGIEEVAVSEEITEIEHQPPEFGEAQENQAVNMPVEEEMPITEQILPLPVEDLLENAPSENPDQPDQHGQHEQQPEENNYNREQDDEGHEDLNSDESFVRPKRPNIRRYKIQEVIKKNQIVLIQVIKEERGNKGASVTTYISLPGRYCVLMPNTNRGGGVSRKINDVKERRKLKDTIDGLEIKEGMSIIVRTAGLGRTKPDITRDYSYLIKLWNRIREDTLAASAPALVYEEGNVIKRGLRDFYNNDVKEVLVAGEKAFETARDFMKLIMPTHVKKIKQYMEPVPLFNKYGIERQLQTMNDPVVTMPSGGYIVINSTEALIAIDVNSGRSTGERNVEDTATRTNIDAAYEIARQLRLRDLAGLIVIDFIDMLGAGHRRQVERTLKDALKVDRAKIQVGRISPFGLLEMSRQRLRPSLTEINMMECTSCKGSGIIRSPDSAMVMLARSIENELAVAQGEGQKILKAIVTCSADLALYFLNNKRKYISKLEETYNFELVIEVSEMVPSAYRIQLENDAGVKTRIISSEDRDISKLPQSRGGDKGKRRSGRGGRNDRPNDRREPRKQRDEFVRDEGSDSATEREFEPAGENTGNNEFPRRGNRHRRGRNRNRNRNRGGRGPHQTGERMSGENITATINPLDEIITSGSFAPVTKDPLKPPRPRREPRPVDAGEESSSGYREKEVREVAHAASEGESDQSGDRKGGWWRKR